MGFAGGMKTTTRLKGLSALVAGLPDLVGSEGAGAVIVLFERDGALAGVLGWADDACDGETAHMLDVVAERRATMGAQAAIAIAYRCEPGRVDIAALAKRIERRVPLHHVLGASDEHWWAIECELGCCDGAIHEIPSLAEQTREQLRDVRRGGEAMAATARPVPSAVDVRAAWARLCDVPATASGTRRRSRSADLQVLADAVVDGPTRDEILLCVAPELFRLLSPGTPLGQPGPPMTSACLRTWLPLVPRHGRAAWKALEAAATWREGDLRGAGACAAASLRIGRTSLGQLLRDITGTGLSYEQAVGALHTKARQSSVV